MGKIIGFLAGLLLAKNFWGAVIFAVIGHFLVDKRRGANSEVQRERLAVRQRVFFETVFKLLGYLAKSDGRINEHEIELTQILMQRMGLNADHKREAITFFKAGAAADFDLDGTLENFRQHGGRRINLRNMVLVYMVELALADGAIGQLEREVLLKVGEGLGYSRRVVEQIVNMLVAQARFQQSYQQSYQSSGAQSIQTQIDSAYEALGVSSSVSDADLKKAYRKLMSQYHPDKLMGQGLPDDMVKAATERAQEVQAAYDLIKKHRGH